MFKPWRTPLTSMKPSKPTNPLKNAEKTLLNPGMPESKAARMYKIMKTKAMNPGENRVTAMSRTFQDFSKRLGHTLEEGSRKFFGKVPEYDYKHDEIHNQLNIDIEDARNIDGIRQYINTNTLIKQQILQNMYQYILDMGRNPEESGITITDEGITGISDNDVIRVVIDYLCGEPELAVTNIDDAQLQEYAVKACGTEMENVEEAPGNPPLKISPRIPERALTFNQVEPQVAGPGPYVPYNPEVGSKVYKSMDAALNILKEQFKQIYYKLSEKDLSDKYELIMAQEPEYGKSIEKRAELEAVKEIYKDRMAEFKKMQEQASKLGGRKTKKSNKSKKTRKTKSKKSRKSKSKKQRK